VKFAAAFHLILLTGVFTGSANAADPKKDCQLIRYSEIPITTLPDGRFTVPITLEGRPLNFLVDTGGSIATVSPEQAHNLQLEIKMTSSYLEGVAGFELYQYSNVGKISLGGIEGRNLDVYIDPELPLGAEGTLAPDMMKHFDVDLDLVRGKLNLFSQNHCKGQVVYWTRSGYVALPMEVVSNGHIQVPVTIDGIKLNALLDTGAQNSIVSISALKGLGLSEASPELNPVGDAKARYKMYEHAFKQLDFDGITVKNPHIMVASDGFLPGRNTDMIIGITILRQLHLYIAYDEEKLYITPASAN
jgi:predicted aspartyl protease